MIFCTSTSFPQFSLNSLSVRWIAGSYMTPTRNRKYLWFATLEWSCQTARCLVLSIFFNFCLMVDSASVSTSSPTSAKRLLTAILDTLVWVDPCEFFMFSSRHSRTSFVLRANPPSLITEINMAIGTRLIVSCLCSLRQDRRIHLLRS